MLCTTLEYHVLVTLPLWVLSVTFHHAAAAGDHQPADFRSACAWRRARRPRCRRNKAALVVASAGGVAVLPAADRARLGALRGPPGAAAHAAGRRSRRSIRSRCATAGSRSAKSSYWAEQRAGPAGVGRATSSPAGPPGLAEQVRHRLERITTWRFTATAGASCSSPPSPKIIRADQQLIRCRLRARWSLAGQVAFWSLLRVGGAGDAASWAPGCPGCGCCC